MKTTVMERTGKIEDMDRSFDLRFWQSQTDAERLATGWELVLHSYIVKGKDVSELRLQRTIEHFQRQER